MRILIVGIGNPLRSDDGIGWKIAELLEEDFRNDLEIEVLAVHQLTPELAERVAESAAVIFVDASVERLPENVSSSEVKPAKPAPSMSFHQLEPTELLGLAGPKCSSIASLVTVGGRNFSFGDQLSADVVRAIPDAIRQVRLAVEKFRSASLTIA